METITSKVENTIAELREVMKGVLPPEMYENTSLLYKFLKARDFKVKQAEIMLRNNIEWRKMFQADTIATDYIAPEVMHKYYPLSVIGFDKEGSIVKYAGVGNVDGEGIFRSINRYDIIKSNIQFIEADVKTLREQTEKSGKPVTQCIYIFDIGKLTLALITHRKSVDCLLIGISMFLDNYPELLKRIYVINASVYFTMVFPIIKPLLSTATIDKIRVFGKRGWKEELLRDIDEDVLPAFLGGKKTDPDGNPLCNTFIIHEGRIPESYYLKKNIEKTAKREGMKKILIEPQSSFRVNIEVKNSGSILEWEFETKFHDIGFRLELKKSSSANCKTVDLIPMQKFETELGPTKGKFRCKTRGIYIIVFDNTHSWFHSKEVYYKKTLLDPAEKCIQ